MIEILRCAPLTTIQDLGRKGFRHLGVGHAGAMDPVAAKQANLLVGNDIAKAVIEVTMGPFEAQFSNTCLVGASGTDFNASIVSLDDEANPKPFALGFVALVNPGDRLQLKRSSVAGGRCYIACSGGFDVPLILNSRSTDINAGFGGLEGRSLCSGDTIALAESTGSNLAIQACFSHAATEQTSSGGIRPLTPTRQLRALSGIDTEKLPASLVQNFWRNEWLVTAQSNRMGIRLQGLTPNSEITPSLLSSGVMPGDVQLPGDGQPIILANDAQTTGGYPRIAHIIDADLWQLAYLPANTPISFSQVSIEEAARASEERAQYWKRLVHWRNLVYAERPGQ